MVAQLKILCLLLAFCSFTIAKTQQNNNWVFGYIGGGINFSNDSPSLFTSKSKALSAPACISDEKGQLQLYFDGTNVYNKTHEIIKNGDILKKIATGYFKYDPVNIFLILPSSSNPSKFYLILGGGKGPPNSSNTEFYPGLFMYSIDINANNGKGELDTNGIHLFSGSTIGSLAATLHSNKHDVWLVCRLGNSDPNTYQHLGMDTLVTLLFDGDNISTKHTYYRPVRDNPIYSLGVGALTFSHNGKLFSETFSDIGQYPNWAKSDSSKTYVSVTKFNNTTGEIEETRCLHYYANSIYAPINGLQKYSYTQNSVFSPNDSILYTIFIDSSGSTLIQLPVYSSDPFKENVKYKFTHGRGYSVGVGSDKRLYIGYHDWDTNSSTRLAVLEYPNKGLKYSNIDLNAYILNVKGQDYGVFWFPNQLHTPVFRPKFSYEKIQCSGTGVINNLSDTLFKKFTWFFDETISMKANKKEDLPFPFNKSKKYSVKLKGETNAGWIAWYSDTIDYLHPPKADLSFNTSTGCKYIAFDFKNKSVADTIKSSGGFAHWFFGDGTDTVLYGTTLNEIAQNTSHTYTKSGIYTVQLIFNNGFCSDTIEKKNAVFIKEAPKPGISVSNTHGCQPLKINIKRSYLDSIVSITYDFGDGNSFNSPPLQSSVDAPTSHNYLSPGSFLIKQSIEGSTGCITQDSIEITILKGFENTIPNLKYASISGDTASILEWDTFDASIKYSLLRSEDKLQWTEISKLNTATLAYCDKSILPKKRNYWYKLRAFDTCDNTRESNIASTLLLTGSSDNNDFSVIEWQPYEEWQGGVSKYSIEVLLNGHWKEIASIGQVRYTDYSFSDEEGVERCYRITAIENGGGTTLSSSNSLCLPYSPVIWIPNGFTPNNDGLNDTFSITTLGIKKLTITIYNSYGEEIYSCNGVDCNWNGEYKGSPCIEGVYSFIISARTGEDKIINHRGTITLLR